MLRVLFSGGGSAGHLAPSVAVWEALHAKRPDAETLFLCAARAEDREFLARSGLHTTAIHAPKLALSPALLLFPITFPIAMIEAWKAIRKFRPHVVFAKGGFVSVPPCFVAAILHIPIVLHESDRVMGRANRLILRSARHLCIGTPQKELGGAAWTARLGIQVTATGNPIRSFILRGSEDGGRRVTGFSGKRPVLLVLGGSQGARAINDVIHASLEDLLHLCDVIHITGTGKGSPEKQHARYMQRDVVHEELPELYAIADIVLSRAGAGTLAELAAWGKAAILVPLPHLAHDHQEENARFLAVARAAMILPQDRLQEELIATVHALIADEGRRRDLGERLRAFAAPDAAERIAMILLAEAKESLYEGQ